MALLGTEIGEIGRAELHGLFCYRTAQRILYDIMRSICSCGIPTLRPGKWVSLPANNP